MTKRMMGWPFQEGFVNDGAREVHVFTDYRWNNGQVSRRWHVAPEEVDKSAVFVHPVSLKFPVAPVQ